MVRGSATDVDRMAVDLSSALYSACGITPPSTSGKRRSVHWWSPSLGTLRKTANHLRRVFQRKRRRLGPAACTEEESAAKSAKLALVKAIKYAKEQAWKQLCDEVERDPWGKPYKIVMGKLNVRSPIPGLNLPGRLSAIIRELFPSHPARTSNALSPALPVPIKKFETVELRSACAKLKNGKAPGLDGVSNEILKILVAHQPDVLLDIFNECLAQGRFPAAWKEAKLVLLRKGDKPLE